MCDQNTLFVEIKRQNLNFQHHKFLLRKSAVSVEKLQLLAPSRFLIHVAGPAIRLLTVHILHLF